MASGQEAGRASVPAPAELGRWRRAVERLRRRPGAGRASRAPTARPSSDLEQRFVARCAELPAPSVLELGTLQSVPGRSTMHRDWVPHAAEFLGTDIEAGPDVDVVADLHRLTRRGRHRALRRDPLGLDVRAPQVPDAGGPRADEGAQGRRPDLHPDPPVVPAARLPERLLPLLPGRAREPVRHADGLRGDRDQLRLPRAPLLARGTRSRQRMPAFLNTTLWGEKRAPTPDEYRYEL